MNPFLHYLYALMFLEAGPCVLFLPVLLLVALVPKRLPGVRHRILACSLAAGLMLFLFSGKIDGIVRNAMSPAPFAASAQQTARQVDLYSGTAAKPAASDSPVFRFRLPEQVSSEISRALSTISILRDLSFAWLLLCYGLGVFLLYKSRPSNLTAGARISRFTKTPITTWFGRHYVILPEDAEDWPEERLSRVMAHEQAHILRKDWFTQLLANFAFAGSAMNPIVWICARKLRGEAELAADQKVLRENTNPSEYANDLLQIARGARYDRNVAVLAMASKGSLKSRIRFILSSNHPKGTSRIAATTALFVGLALPAACQVLLDIAGTNGLPIDASQAQDGASVVPDIRDGLTVSGQSSNGWVGTFSDGTQAKLCGIYYGTSSGVVFLNTDGDPATYPSKANPWETGHPGRLDLVFSMPSIRLGPDLGAGIGTSSFHPKSDPRRMTFAGGYMATSFDGSKSYVHSFLEIQDKEAKEFSVSLTFSGRDTAESAVSLADLQSGKSVQVPQGNISWAHRTNAEKICLRDVGLPSDFFGVRVETPNNSMTTFNLFLADQPTAKDGVHAARGCGGQEDATPGYGATQCWFAPAAAKKYAVVEWRRYYQVEFPHIPLHWPTDGQVP